MMRAETVLYFFSTLLGLVVPSAIDVAVDEKKRANHVVDSLDLLLYVLLGSQCCLIALSSDPLVMVSRHR